MIEVHKAKSYRCCNCCGSQDDVIEIYYRMNWQGTGVALCKKCTNELINKISERSDDAYNLIKKLQAKNKALRKLVEWAVECDFGYDNLGDWWVDRFKDEIEGMDYTEGLIHLAERYVEV
ncbi:MAG: hypothetical protein IKU40_08150, partial [Clostridia bacterium]|nr:hypothetical protein [Clostridia bacterium]